MSMIVVPFQLSWGEIVLKHEKVFKHFVQDCGETMELILMVRPTKHY